MAPRFTKADGRLLYFISTKDMIYRPQIAEEFFGEFDVDYTLRRLRRWEMITFDHSTDCWQVIPWLNANNPTENVRRGQNLMRTLLLIGVDYHTENERF